MDLITIRSLLQSYLCYIIHMKRLLEQIISNKNNQILNEISFLKFYTTKTDTVALPQISSPYLYIILDGAIRFPDLKECKQGEYFVSEITTPNSVKIVEKPFQALSLAFTNDEIISVMLEIEGVFQPKNNDENILNCIKKLLALSENDNKFLQKHIKREIIFNLITGQYGKDFMEKVVKFQNADEIYKINSWIKENFKSDFTVEELAEQANMSTSGFHQKFKNAVGMGPIQCQKKLRLLEARHLMLDGDKNVTQAALEVGYESVSQFVRDYKKILGLPPKEDILKIKNCAKNLQNKASN